MQIFLFVLPEVKYKHIPTCLLEIKLTSIYFCALSPSLKLMFLPVTVEIAQSPKPRGKEWIEKCGQVEGAKWCFFTTL